MFFFLFLFSSFFLIFFLSFFFLVCLLFRKLFNFYLLTFLKNIYFITYYFAFWTSKPRIRMKKTLTMKKSIEIIYIFRKPSSRTRDIVGLSLNSSYIFRKPSSRTWYCTFITQFVLELICFHVVVRYQCTWFISSRLILYVLTLYLLDIFENILQSFTIFVSRRK